MRESVVFLLSGVIFVLFPLAYGFQYGYESYTRYGPVPAWIWSSPLLLVALIAFLGWGIILLQVIRHAHRAVEVHKYGLHLDGYRHVLFVLPRTIDIYWGQITGISSRSARVNKISHRGVQSRVNHSFTIFLNQRKPIHISEADGSFASRKNLVELISRLKAGLYPRLLPVLQANLTSGSELSFGPLTLQKGHLLIRPSGLAFSLQKLPWDRIKLITILSGFLVVKLDGSGGNLIQYRFPASNIPNLELLLQLIDGMTNAE